MALTGYAEKYAEARASGKSDTQAHAAATQATGTGGSGWGTQFASFEGSADSNPLGYEIQGGRTYLTGVIPQYDDYIGVMNPITQQPQQPPPQQQPNINAYIEQLKAAKRESMIAALDKARTTALSSLDTEKANVAPTYYDKRNQAAAASDVGAMNFAQYMAARGIKGAAGAMPEIYRQAGLQGQIGALDRAEANTLANIERQRSNVESGYASDVAAANADVESQAMQAMIDQWNANRTYELQKAGLTGSLGDTRTLAGLEYDWSRSPSNPVNIAAILANKAQELENAANEIKNSYLPETLKMEAERLAQQVKAGALDYDTALAQLNQIRARGSGGGGGGTTATKTDNLAARQQEVSSWIYGGQTPQQVEAKLYSPDVLSQLTQEGIDVNKLVDTAYLVKYGVTKSKYLEGIQWTPQ
jgi:hypothetical protein